MLCILSNLTHAKTSEQFEAVVSDFGVFQVVSTPTLMKRLAPTKFLVIFNTGLDF